MATIDLAQFHQTFFDESFEGLDAMEAGLLGLDGADADLVNTIFRAAHSIKGGAGTFGFPEVAAFTHVAEELLDDLRSGKREATPQLADVLLRAVDALRGMLTRARHGEPARDAESDAVLDDLRSQLTGAPSAPQPSAGTEVALAPPAATGWDVVFRPHPQLLRTGNDPLRLLRELEALGPLTVEPEIERLPALQALDPESCVLGWRLRLDAPVSRAAVTAVFEWIEDDCELAVEPIMSCSNEPETAAASPVQQIALVPPRAAMAPAAAAASGPLAPAAPTRARVVAGRGDAEAGSIRVGTDKIDQLINTVGELVITQSMLSQLGERFEPALLEALRAGLVQLERNTRELQESVMRIRMLPIGTVFHRFPRLVHDLGGKLGKQVRLDLHGADTELDKTVLEKIGDPLVHLVRNAIDHGLESPERRRAAGKPEVGTLRLNAFHRGGSIVIEIADDGAGLDRDAIVRKAVERGLIADGSSLDDAAVAELIFQPGFSTAAVTTDVSGRGVGMDVVRRNVIALNGHVGVRSRPGEGTTFTITLPLTLAIIDGLTALVGGESYIVPLVAIVESLQLKPGQVNRVGSGGEVFRFRDSWLPIVRLHALFGCADAITEPIEGIVVVAEGDGRRVGLLVDALAGQQQAVIKSLDAHYRRIEGVSGATILGDGSVALIVDVPGLARLAQRRAAA